MTVYCTANMGASYDTMDHSVLCFDVGDYDNPIYGYHRKHRSIVQMTVYCSTCDNVHPDGKADRPWDWRCLRAPAAPGYHFVSPDYSPSPPYQLCRFINTTGECSMWTPRRVAPDVTE